MKVLKLLVLALFTSATLLATTPFTRESTGYDWKTASLSYRAQWCDDMAKKMQKIAPGLTGDVIYDGLSTFYDDSNPDILKQKVSEMMALIVTVWVKNKDDQ